ncbi:hypothetical protein I203_105370 [Kwoniella mangroviensis CBS 8507]|uniref:uncharacterized protein n=1 Tax=Kwoniella mangroviensis CBS 8507 TaxID=1296122 RepID=UPI00080CE3EF|nr:uncharacterized protein I203_01187 [Kwoniella mangroviensis CBS 8507]OCF69330.1 hypothetical protein I203_01187 [Kwoniella mangroviensis CBS 8507]
MRSSTISLLSILPFITGSALASTKSCSAKGTTGSSVIGVAAVATDGTTSAVAPSSSSSGDHTPPVGEVVPTSAAGDESAVSSVAAVDTGSSSSLTSASAALPTSTGGSSNSTGGNSNDPTISSGSHPTFEFKQPDKEDCKCGYKVSGLGDIYMPFKFQFNFSDIGDAGPFSGPDDLKQYGWRINQGHHAGGPSSNGTIWDEASGTLVDDPIYQCLGDPGSVSIQGGNLHLTMKGGQTPSGEMKCPEIIHDNATLYGIFQADIQLDNTPGTCQAFWMNHTIPGQYADELDIEALGGSMLEPTTEQPLPGLWSTNWDPNGNPNEPLDLNHTTGTDGKSPTPFPNDPTADFNSYIIAWVPGEYSPRYYNGKEIASPSQYNAIHAQEATFNNWSNNNKWWSGTVPQSDVTMKVRSVLFYYRTEEIQSLIDGCKEEDVCTV